MTAGRPRPRALARPLAPAPPGSGTGLLSLFLMASALPMVAAMAEAERTPRGAEAWLDWIGWCFGFSLLLVIPPMLGWMSRRYWSIAWLWCAAALLLLAYPVVLVIAVPFPLGWRPPGVADETILADCTLGVLVALAPFWFGLFRLVRLRYFQPWTRPDQWEREQSRTPDWAMRIVRITRPVLAAQIDRDRAARRAAGDHPADRGQNAGSPEQSRGGDRLPAGSSRLHR